MKHQKLTTLLLIFAILSFCSCNNRREIELGQTRKLSIYNCLLDSVTNRDTLFIKYQTKGCEHDFNELIKIYKQGDSFVAALIVNVPIRKRTFRITNILSDSSLLAYKQFESQGRTLKTISECTTTENFEISIKSNRIRFEDNDCSFDGYFNLENKLFGLTAMKEKDKKIYR